MKVKNAGYNYWEIYNDEKLVARIETFNGFRRNTKSLHVNDKQICEIKNQKEAIEKLEEFFSDVKTAIKTNEELIEQLTIGMKQVEHRVCVDALEMARRKYVEELEVLKTYDLI